MATKKAKNTGINTPRPQAQARGRAGVTINPERRKSEWERKYPDISNWQAIGPFLSMKEAQEWTDAQVGYERGAKGDDPEPNHPFVLWYGYRFDYAPARELRTAPAMARR